MFEIPYQQLSETALLGLIEEFITREGTDYGDRDYNLGQKVEQVLAQLRRGEVVITFDPTSETCSLITKSAFKKQATSTENEYFSGR